MSAMATRPGNRKDQGLAGAARRRPETTMGGREARGGANFAVLGVSLFCCATLVACGGGGGGGGSAGGGVVQFTTSFSQLAGSGAGGGSPFNGTVEMSSLAISAEITATSTGGPTSLALGRPVFESGTVRIRVQDGALRSFNIRGQRVNANFPSADLVGDIMDPVAAGYEYQTFGWWSGEPGATTSRSWGAASFGRKTEAANLPNSQATYAADSVGLLVDNGKAYGTTSAINISTADYTNVTVSSTNTMKTEIQDDGSAGSETRDTNLDFTGVGQVKEGGFTIHIRDGGSRPGKFFASFYGPNAEEIGGTFDLEAANSRHMGAFGGKKQ